MEHHLKDYELSNTHIPAFKLGAKYCRSTLKQGCVCIYVHESLKFTNINLQKYCNEQDIELAAIQIKNPKEKIVIICIYRAPSGNFDTFLHNLKIILNSFFTPDTEFIICEDIKINYLKRGDKKTG